MSRSFDYARRGDEFPFWRVVLAVAVGVLIASAVQWGVGLVMLKLATDSAAQAMREAAAKVEAESIKVRQEIAHRQAVKRAADRDAREGVYVQPAAAVMPDGTVACLAGRIVLRDVNGWQEIRAGRGLPAGKCRTVR